jgi:hypothetical protein
MLIRFNRRSLRTPAGSLRVLILLAAGFALGQLSTWPVKLDDPGGQNHVEGMRLVELAPLRQNAPSRE